LKRWSRVVDNYPTSNIVSNILNSKMFIVSIFRIVTSIFVKQEPILPIWHTVSTAIAPKIDAIIVTE
jgi:hypothetical protein